MYIYASREPSAVRRAVPRNGLPARAAGMCVHIYIYIYIYIYVHIM